MRRALQREHEPGRLGQVQAVAQTPCEEQPDKLERLVAPVVLQPQAEQRRSEQRCEKRERDEAEQPGALASDERSRLDPRARSFPPARGVDEDPKQERRQQVSQLLGNESGDVEASFEPRKRVTLLRRVFERRQVMLDNPADVGSDDDHRHGDGEDRAEADRC